MLYTNCTSVNENSSKYLFLIISHPGSEEYANDAICAIYIVFERLFGISVVTNSVDSWHSSFWFHKPRRGIQCAAFLIKYLPFSKPDTRMFYRYSITQKQVQKFCRKKFPILSQYKTKLSQCTQSLCFHSLPKYSSLSKGDLME